MNTSKQARAERIIRDALRAGGNHYQKAIKTVVDTGLADNQTAMGFLKRYAQLWKEKDQTKNLIMRDTDRICTQGGHDPYR